MALLAYLQRFRRKSPRCELFCANGSWTRPCLAASEKTLDRMLLTLADRGFVTLDPPPPLLRRLRRMTLKLRFAHALPGSPDYQVIRATPRPRSTSCSSFAASTRFTALFSSTNSASPTATNGFRRWKACWRCRERCCAACACPPPSVAAGPVGDDAPRRRPDPPRPHPRTHSPSRKMKRKTTKRRKNIRQRWPISCGYCSTPCIPTWPTFSTQSVWAASELMLYNGDFNLDTSCMRDLVKQERHRLSPTCRG